MLLVIRISSFVNLCSVPNVCALRDKNFGKLEKLLIDEILSDRHKDGISLQTAIGGLEVDLG